MEPMEPMRVLPVYSYRPIVLNRFDLLHRLLPYLSYSRASWLFPWLFPSFSSITSSSSSSAHRRRLCCWPFSYATHYAKNTKRERGKDEEVKRRKKRASNKTEEAILLREQTRRGRGE